MLYRTVSLFSLIIAVAAAGCRDNNTLTPADLSMPGGGGSAGGGGGGGGDLGVAMKTYQMSTVHDMRVGKPGNFQLTNVVAIALTPSTKSPKLWVQDAAGGDFSAMMTRCSSSSTSHPCSVASTVATVAVGHSVTVQGTYIKTAASGFEEFYIDMITDNGAGTLPAPLTLTEADIVATPSAPPTMQDSARFFQRATVTPTEDIVMYDWTPATLKFSGSWGGCTVAPFVFGFGMIPASAGTAGTGACTTKTAAAPSNATANAKEIYIGTDFYKSFDVSSDCQCAKAPTQVPSATTKWAKGTALTGTVNFDVPVMATQGYVYFSPTDSGSASAFANLVAPPTM